MSELMQGTCVAPEPSEGAVLPQLSFERLIADLSARFINLPADKVSEHIMAALHGIAAQLHLDRCTVFERVGEDQFKVTHGWAGAGIEPIRDLLSQQIPWITRRVLVEQQRFYCSGPDEWPAGAGLEREMMIRLKERSMAAFPLSAEGKSFGALAFGSVHRQIQWSEELIDRLGLVAEVFSSAIERMRSEQRLKQAMDEIKALKVRLENENVYLREERDPHGLFEDIVGRSPVIRQVLRQVEQVAATRATVLLLGETGTGKELLADAIHSHSPRRDRLLVKVNCAGLAPTLIESELFGRERGAYTGALTAEAGRFELAHGSSILLDEVGELPMELQAKLLRVLQEGEFERLGSTRTRKVDVRVIAATNRDLMRCVEEGTFRGDLYYRLNVFPIHVPPLRERREDIPAIVRSIAQKLAAPMGKSITSVSQESLKELAAYHWPGNIRELRNLVERALILCDGPVLHIPVPAPVEAPAQEQPASKQPVLLEDVEREHIRRMLEKTGWRVSGPRGAAELLGLKRTTLESRMLKLGIARP